MSKHSKRNDNSFKRIITILFSIIFIFSIILIFKIKMTENIENEKQREVSKVLDTIHIENEKKENQIDIANNITERVLKVRELQKENADIIGWLEIEGTNINYPVLQGKDNDYYLTHNYKNEKISSGSIFLDRDYDFNKPSANLLIYGHRNKVGLMFEDLIKYKSEKFYKDHKIIRFTTAKEDAEYEILAAFKSRVYYKDEKNVFRYYYFVNANNIFEYKEYVENCKKASLYDTEINAIYEDQLMTLSTCDYEVENGRFVVVAKKIK